MGNLTSDLVIKIAKAESGYLEKKSNAQLDDKTANAGSANYTKYGRDMHAIYPSIMDFPAAWCDAFVDWCFYKAFGVANAKGLLAGDFNDYTVASAQLYKNKGAWYTSNPKVGDQIFFNNGTKGKICHTGLVTKVDAAKVYTSEGNTSSTSGVVANGGCVREKSYALNYSRIEGYGRPKYDVAESSNSSVKVTDSMEAAQSFDKNISGTYSVTATALNLRKGAGTSKAIICLIPKGASVKCFGYFTVVKNVKWYYISYNSYVGFVSSEYLKK